MISTLIKLRHRRPHGAFSERAVRIRESVKESPFKFRPSISDASYIQRQSSDIILYRQPHSLSISFSLKFNSTIRATSTNAKENSTYLRSARPREGTRAQPPLCKTRAEKDSASRDRENFRQFAREDLRIAVRKIRRKMEGRGSFLSGRPRNSVAAFLREA